jgi:hypothetical protein
MTYARLVSFTNVMNSFPVGGMTMRIACGTITRRRMRGRRDLMLRGDLLQRPVLLQRLDRRLQRGAQLGLPFPVIDSERVGLREQVGDCELAGLFFFWNAPDVSCVSTASARPTTSWPTASVSPG